MRPYGGQLGTARAIILRPVQGDIRSIGEQHVLGQSGKVLLIAASFPTGESRDACNGGIFEA